MRRLGTVAAAAAVTTGLLAAPAMADEPVPELVWREHGHVLLLGADVDLTEGPPQVNGFERCVPLANGRQLKLSQHHEKLHMGRANEALITQAGHIIQPTGHIIDIKVGDTVVDSIVYPADCDAWAAFVNGG
jgi:hypothetical protein